jgi:adenine/guanine phosphoribosyltransferase-like PRPP-binding protein
MDEHNLVRELANLGLQWAYLAGRRTVVWRYWGVYLDPDLVQKLVQSWVARLSKVHAIDDVDYLCAVPKSGLVLGGYLQSLLRKPMITFDWDHDSVHRPDLVPPQLKVLVVDSSVNTGGTLAHSQDKLNTVRAEVAHAAVWVLNDLLPDHLDHRFKADLLDRHGLTWLYTVSELLPHWERRDQMP